MVGQIFEVYFILQINFTYAENDYLFIIDYVIDTNVNLY
jgi:hypothetical protein